MYMWGAARPIAHGRCGMVRRMPPTMRDLLADPVFRLYYKQVPVLPESVSWGEPWMVWAVTHTGKWGQRKFETYREAWGKLVEIHKQQEKFRDVAIVSRRVMFPPPANGQWPHKFSWCSRCRRPSEFKLRSPDHHALRSQPTLTDDDAKRCYYCGIRRVSMPHYSGRGYGR